MLTDFFVKYNYYAMMLIQWLILVEGILKKLKPGNLLLLKQF
jgi:hypothetical protein